MQNELVHAFLSGVVAANNIAPGEPCNGPTLWRAYAEEMGIEGSLLKHPQKKGVPDNSEYDKALKYATNMAKHMRFTYYPKASGCEPLGDLTGILMQLDIMVAGIVRNAERVKQEERKRCLRITKAHGGDKPFASRATADAIANAIMEDPA